MTHLRVVRKNFVSPLPEEQQAHSSETALDGYEPDYYIKNDGDLHDLEQTLSEWLTNFAGGVA